MQPQGNTSLERLHSLLALPHETEWLEFKEAKRNIDFDDLGKYFSALSNEAFLKEHEYGWLVLGVSDDHSVCGTAYREDPAKLQQLKHEIASQTYGRLTFEAIHVVAHPLGRVVMFQIPPASPGIPTDWKGHWYGRNGESRVPLSLSRLQRIISGSSELTELDRFGNHLMDPSNWKYDGKDTAVYLPNADFVIRIEEAEKIYGAGNYWWGNLLHEKPTMLSYRLMCKGQEVHKVLVVLFQNECLRVPFPCIKTIADPHEVRPGYKTAYYADVFYYQKDSIKYKMLYHIRAVEIQASTTTLSSPIKSQIKPTIIRLPFPIVEDCVEADLLMNRIEERLPKFNSENESRIATITSGGEQKRMAVEKLFSGWVHSLWES